MLRPRPRSLLLWLAAAGSSCAGPWWAPDLEREPWAQLEPGAARVTLQPGAFTLYGVEGDFEADTPAKGPLSQGDDGDFVGRFGLALRGELVLRPNLVAALGADYRRYDIEGLNPIEELTVELETIDSLQYFASLRYLFEPFDGQPRLRPFAQASVAYLPTVDVAFEVDLSEFGSSNLVIDTEGEGYWVGAGALGLVYHWTDRLELELGLAYELPLTPLDVDLSFSIGPSTVPMSGELEPAGLIGFWGLSWTL